MRARELNYDFVSKKETLPVARNFFRRIRPAVGIFFSAWVGIGALLFLWPSSTTGPTGHWIYPEGARSPAALQVSAPKWKPDRPFNEFEPTGYVAISGDPRFELSQLRNIISENLPEGVKLIVYVDRPRQIEQLAPQLVSGINRGQVQFLYVPEGFDEIWARDSFPFPVHLTNGSMGLLEYFYPKMFQVGGIISNTFSLPIYRSTETFRGGEIIADLEGNCFVEDAGLVKNLKKAKEFLYEDFGCKTVTHLPSIGSLGDVDDRLKLMPGKIAVTDHESVGQQVQALGYRVVRMPSADAIDHSYLNALVVNQTVFVPQFGTAADEVALDVYRGLGLEPIGVKTPELNALSGSIHCVTMNYPVGTFDPTKHGLKMIRNPQSGGMDSSLKRHH